MRDREQKIKVIKEKYTSGFQLNKEIYPSEVNRVFELCHRRIIIKHK